MSDSKKTQSPAELAKLEHAFASDPASEAYKPLAEAYLAMGRFMEAMVVCKKGVKAHPTVAAPRVLLARVYADQGKDKKAIEELQGALGVAANDKVALRSLGVLQFRSGEVEVGRASLLKAYESDPSDAETLQAMGQAGVAVPRRAEPPPPPPPAMAAHVPVLQPTATSMGDIDISLASHVNLPPVHSQAALPPVMSQGTVPQARRPPPRQASQQRLQPVRRPVDDDDDVDDEVSNPRASKPKSSGSARAMFFLMAFMVPLAAVAYYAIGQYKAVQAREVRQLLNKANEFLKADTFASYKSACEAAEQALDKDPSSPGAHAYLAYSYIIRWGEHERDDLVRQKAEEHLSEAKRGGKEFSHLYAADALHKYYTGKGTEARAELEGLVKKLEAETKRPALLQLTLGLIQMNLGDVETAKETLEKAQANAPDDPRVFVALGTLARRRGNDTAALANFNSALRYTRNSHPDALAGTALAILDQDNPGVGYITAAKYIKALLEAAPPPSPRQLAMAHFARALLVSRLVTDIPLYTDKAFQQQLQDGTGIGADLAKARSDINKEEEAGLSLDRNNPELFLVRGKRLAFERKLDEAIAEIRKAVDANGQLAHFHVELARVQMRKEGGDKDAETSLRKAISLVPNSPKLLALLGQVLYRQKKADEARTTLERAVEDPKVKNPEARYLLARLFRDERRDPDKAIPLFEQAAKEYFSDPTNAAMTYDDLAQAYEMKNDKDKSRTTYEKALNADREYAPAYCHYARFLSKNGEPKERVKEIAKEGARLDPQSECAADLKRLSD